MSSTTRVGWVAAATLHGSMSTFRRLPRPFPAMRIVDNAKAMTRHAPEIRTEMYRRDRRYDVVVFMKTMDAAAQEEAERIRAYGGRVVFDANVNYYEVWGEYDIDGTRPTDEENRDAIAFTTAADWVVADSTYLLDVVARFNERVSWIPDNVDLRVFRPARRPRRDVDPLRLVWSGVAKKGRPLLMLTDVFRSLDGLELVLVTECEPEVMAELEHVIACRLVPFDSPRLARELRRGDVIVSPKRLINAYEMCHTEYKIAVGMACALPAVASPQQSYVEAIGADGGGMICDTEAEWHDAFVRLRDDAVRHDLGRRARKTVLERYTAETTGRAYADLVRTLVGGG